MYLPFSLHIIQEQKYFFEITKQYFSLPQFTVRSYIEKLYSNRLRKTLNSLGINGAFIVPRTVNEVNRMFWSGKLFNESNMPKLAKPHKLQISMGPICYSTGYMQIPLKSIFTLFLGKGDLLGHSGTTGSFAFYYPHKDLFFTGDVNQLANPGLPIRMLIKLAMTL